MELFYSITSGLLCIILDKNAYIKGALTVTMIFCSVFALLSLHMFMYECTFMWKNTKINYICFLGLQTFLVVKLMSFLEVSLMTIAFPCYL